MGNYKTYRYIWVVVLVFAGCNDFLDVNPDNRVELNDLDKAQQLLTNAYSVASPTFTDWMTDDFTYTFGTTIRPAHAQMYAWEDVNTSPDEQDTPDYFWYETYAAIAHANEVLAVLDELPVDSDEDQAKKLAVEAEALLTRAYGHFMLVNMFGEHYETSTSALGIPYVTKPETTFLAEYERLSVSRVYSRIEDDLVEGLEKLDDSFYSNSGKYHFNQNAALAFASRFYLYKGDRIRSLQYSNQLLGDNPQAYIRDFNSTEYQAAKSSIDGYPQLYSGVDEPANLLLMRKISLMQRTDFAFGIEENYYGQLFASNPFGATDERENPAFVKGLNALFPLRYESLFERSSLNSNTGTPYHIGVMFRGEEVLFNRIEANIYSGNLTDALADFQVLTDRRYSGVADLTLTLDRLRTFFGADNEPSFTNQLILLNYLLIERRKEFIAQGMRWFDIKRFGMEVTHQYGDSGSATLTADDPRKILQIPQSAQDVGGLEANPR
ncbi:RagB/SusD family nutrient uptake outer membrane protein [Reichenbachiella agariperforans]|uniref:RagB/SusD family nutrient uptake outer membrane protein n=1 Tax=Reichenbachiella agariperforans TaxID=156994 RepID=UPI001C09C646|nr:RagB/SusD family nutrient uptake outer membrane protein [Reichenbachiella agariperforans]MBU2913492.1 RagB/SusD family nutrient uptake outer membrane protein [Reichenbachiella agariperforans]